MINERIALAESKVVNRLKVQASKLGANAVIGIRAKNDVKG